MTTPPLHEQSYSRPALQTRRGLLLPIDRAWDAIPGGLAWASVGLVVIGAVIAPLWVVGGAALLSAYAAIRFVFAAAANVRGLREIRAWTSTDWDAVYNQRTSDTTLPLDAVRHVVIIPNYREDLIILRHTLRHLAEHNCAQQCMTVVLAMEGAEESAAWDKAQRLRAEFEHRFEHFFTVFHPKGIAGELRCKSSNQAWAARWVRRKLVDDLGYELDHLVVTSMDSDTVWHPAYFEALRVLFATDPRRYATYWQAPLRYHGNVWSINPLMRILHAYASAWELAYLAAPWWQALPMSSYSMSMRLLDEAGYWDPDVIADEWHMYIKTFFQRRGDVRLQPVLLPFLANATPGHSMFQAMRERYWQTFRHAWGAKEIGYTLAQMRRQPDVSFWDGFHLLFRVAHDNLLAGAGWLIMMLGAQIPLALHPDLLGDPAGRTAFVLLQVSVSVITLLTILFWLLDLRMRPARDSRWTWRERLSELASLPLLAVITLVCVALPVIHAQTRLALGLPLEFRVTPKR